ncbi:MAG: SDR family oxidoreductase [Lachnospiraceae bacterium]|nr:SDR family oxidoreductase [Lachnospiraceae bacterium]
MKLDTSAKLKELFSLEDKVILVTGAAGGIFSEVSKGMAQVGGAMALCDFNEEGLKKVEDEITGFGGKAKSFCIDMTSLDSIRSCVEQIIEAYGRIDVLVNGAGINKRVRLIEGDEETFDRIVAVNLKGVHFLSQEVAKRMKETGGGSVINVTSYNSVMMLGGCGVYGATKSGVAALTRAQAIEWAEFGIRSNAICPGHISTPLTEPLWTDQVRSKFLLDRIAMNRPGKPADLLGLAILLASDASSYMSGMMYHVDGGCLAGGQPWDL